MIRIIMILLLGVTAANAALEFEYVSFLGGDGNEGLPLVVLDEDGWCNHQNL
jgi:hypothetical protein